MTQHDIPDDAAVVRGGKATRALFESNIARTLRTWGFAAFSVSASNELTAEQISRHLPHDHYVSCTGKELREAGFESKKTGDNPLHYSVLTADGLDDETWGKLETLFAREEVPQDE